MARTTRSGRPHASPSPADTPSTTTVASPFFSAKNSRAGTDTPATSIIGEPDEMQVEEGKPTLRRSTRGTAAKRPAREIEEEEEPSMPPSKKRNAGRGAAKSGNSKKNEEGVTNRAFVEIEIKKPFETPQKGAPKVCRIANLSTYHIFIWLL